jgi:hypothetical protein
MALQADVGHAASGWPWKGDSALLRPEYALLAGGPPHLGEGEWPKDQENSQNLRSHMPGNESIVRLLCPD